MIGIPFLVTLIVMRIGIVGKISIDAFFTPKDATHNVITWTSQHRQGDHDCVWIT